ncbi:MAG: aminotransferase class V-fold PLP-dependent enzyme, partial [Patescibacteria group bacterium]|nr:aminotransferase class V-fold PLP-dependent enzyme [Patescibacteria group bacterium]
RADIVFSSYIHHLYGVDNPINTLKSLYPSSKLVVDASQAISRMPVNVKKLQCDALMFSAEKAGGLSGVGVLFIAKKHHKKIKQTIEPHSMPVVAVAALDSAISVLKSADIYSINRTLSTQTSKIIESLNSIDGLSFTKGIGYPDNKCHGNGIVSFTIDGYDSKDIASFLDDNNIQVRAGDHCIDEKHQTRNVVRISSHIFNDDEQIDLLLQTLHHL